MTVRIGLIGCGVMGEDHARLLMQDVPGAQLAALFEPSQERLALARALAPAARRFEDAEELIADPSIDAVVVASPDATHARLARAAIRAGKPALIEKPLGTTPEEAYDVVQAEVANGRRLLQLGLMRRFDPGYAALRATVVSGRLGAPLFLHCRHRNAVAPDYIDSDLVLTNSAVHDFDIARFLLGEDPVSVAVTQVRAGRQTRRRQPLFLVLESAGGAVVTVENFVDAHYGYDVQAELVCESGTEALAPQPPIVERWAGMAGFAIEEDWRGRFRDAYRLQLRDFVRFAAGGPPAGASAHDGYVASRIAAFALASRREGRRVPIDLGSPPALYA